MIVKREASLNRKQTLPKPTSTWMFFQSDLNKLSNNTKKFLFIVT